MDKAPADSSTAAPFRVSLPPLTSNNGGVYFGGAMLPPPIEVFCHWMSYARIARIATIARSEQEATEHEPNRSERPCLPPPSPVKEYLRMLDEIARTRGQL